MHAPSYAVVDLFASYQLSENFTLAADVNDLFVGYPWALTPPRSPASHPRSRATRAGRDGTVHGQVSKF